MISTPNDECVRLQGLNVAFGAQRVLDGLDWSLPTGQVVGLLGRNGSGKTTLIESLLGLREPDAGNALLFGQQSNALDDANRARIGYVPQRSDLFEWLTADQLLAYFRSFYPRWNTAKVDGLMSRWDIARRRDARAIPPATPTVSVDPATLEDLFLALTP